MSKDIFDLIVIGAGASGMTAAVCAADKGINEFFGNSGNKKSENSILIIEKNKKTGQKLYATGNGKCNLSNDYFDLKCYNSENEFFPFEVVGSEDFRLVNKFINYLGVKLTSEKGYYYPLSKQASSVVWALNDAVSKCGICVHKSETVTEIQAVSEGSEENPMYKITTDKCVYYGKRVVISCGGKAAPRLGGTDIGYDLLNSLGIPVINPMPALCKLKPASDIEKLAGVRISAEEIVINKDTGEEICSDKGEVQFTEKYISGIATFNISREASRLISEGEGVILRLRLVPDMSREEITDFMMSFKKNNPERKLLSALNGLINDKAASYILKSLKIENTPVKDVTNDETAKIALTMKNLDFEIDATSGFDDAQVTMGGADTRFINACDMSIKMYKNLYITGELIDVDGICGGYNLMWAIITGMKAGFAIYND